MYARPYYANSPLHNLPKGTVAITRFASMVGIAQSAIMRHVAPGINGDRIAVTKVIWQERLCRYVTPEQQQAAFVFWDKHGIKYRKPASIETVP